MKRAQRTGGWSMKVVPRLTQQHAFEVLPRRWVVERAFARLGGQWRLSKDYLEFTETTKVWIHTAMTSTQPTPLW